MSPRSFEGRIHCNQSRLRQCSAQDLVAQECWQLLQFLAFAPELRMSLRVYKSLSREELVENESFNRKLPNPDHLRVVDVVVL
jgi:hypothetical protein